MVEDQRTGSAKFVDYRLFQVQLFWADHTLIDLGSLLAPDLLHQMHKGMFKDHLVKWVQEVMTKKTMDERFTSMPKHHGVHHFKHGITSVSQWTGRGLKEMAKVFLPTTSHCDASVIWVARALLDFVYLAHLSSLTDDEINVMEDALQVFHENKEVLVTLQAIDLGKFNDIPKLHMMQHYTHLIRQLGTPDGYNTETSERLHIDFAKSGYRASNRVNPLKQMALYLQRVEAIEMHLTHLITTQPEAYRGSKGTSYEDDPLGDADIDDDDYLFEEEEAEDEDLDGLVCLPLVSFEEFASRNGGEGGTWERGRRGRPEEAEEEAEEDRQPIFYPAPAYKLSKKPTRCVTGDFLIKSHSATHLVPAIRSFLRKHTPAAERVPFSASDTFSVWSRARLLHAPPPFKPSEGPKLDALHTQPTQSDQYGH
ncbi:hypothetical protein FRC06_008153, partial [Ceratobasidium sp. 370]